MTTLEEIQAIRDDLQGHFAAELMYGDTENGLNEIVGSTIDRMDELIKTLTPVKAGFELHEHLVLKNKPFGPVRIWRVQAIDHSSKEYMLNGYIMLNGENVNIISFADADNIFKKAKP